MAGEAVDYFDQAIVGNDARLDRLAARRHFVEPARIHLAILAERERARDRRRGHREQMRRTLGLLRQQHTLGDAEAMLLVDHRQAEPFVIYRLLEDGVGADEDVNRAIRQPH